MDNDSGYPQELFEFTPRPRIKVVNLTNGECCWVVDDVLVHPERIREWAAEHHAKFRTVEFNYYPGVFLHPPENVGIRLTEFFNVHIRRRFDARRVRSMYCQLSLVTLPPHALRPIQWFCHRDASLLAPEESRQASILYLFKESALGGTSFYEPARSPVETALLFRDATAMTPETFSQKYAIHWGYMGASNGYFNRVGGVAAKWNRMIFYDGHLMHSGDIPEPHRLSNDPLRGRLTLNGFFVSRRHVR